MLRLLLLSVLLGHISFAQTTIGSSRIINIHCDSINSSPNISFNDEIKLDQIDKSTANIDIRLYKCFSLSNTKSVRRLFLIDTTWEAVEFDESNKSKEIKKHSLTVMPSFDTFLLRLLSYNILTLPNQSDLKNKMHKYNEETKDGYSYKTERKMCVTDGEGYTIEIKLGNKFRIYQFNNPDAYSKFYDNVLELKNYLNIVQTFDNFLVSK